MPFDISEFIADPAGKLSTLSHAKKADLFSLARQLHITIPSSALKSQVLNSILDYYVDLKILTEELVANWRTRTGKVEKEIELARIQLRLAEEKQRLLKVV